MKIRLPVIALHAAVVASMGLLSIEASAARADVNKADNALPLSDAGSWQGPFPTATDVIVFGPQLLTQSSFTLDEALAVGGVRATSPANDISIAAGSTLTLGALVLGSGGIDLSAATRALAMTTVTQLSDSQTFNTATSLSVGVLNIASHTLTIAGAGTTTLSAVGGTGKVIKSGTGLLQIRSAASGPLSGGLTLLDGTTRFDRNTSAGTGTLTLGGGNLILSGTGNYAHPVYVQATAIIQQTVAALTLSGRITGDGTIHYQMIPGSLTPSLTLSNNPTAGTFTGLLDFGSSSGLLRLLPFDGKQLGNASLQLGTGNMVAEAIDGGALHIGALSGGPSALLRAGVSTVNNTDFILGGNNASSTFNGAIINGTAGTTASLTKTGAGVLTLTGTGSNYSGPLSISAGTFNFSHASALGTSPDSTRLSSTGTPATLRFFGAGASSGRPLVIASHGIIESSGTGPLTFTSTGGVGWGTTNQLRTLTLTGTNALLNSFSVRITDNGAIAARLIKSGPGAWLIANSNNNFTGGTTIQEGSLILLAPTGNPLGTGAVTILANGTLQLGNGGTTGEYNGPALNIAGTLAIQRSGEGTLSSMLPFAALSGDGILAHTGAGTLRINKTVGSFTGVLDVRAGLVKLEATPGKFRDARVAFVPGPVVDSKVFTATLDVGTSLLIVDTLDGADKTAKVASLRGAISSGSAGNWTGVGITSGAAAMAPEANGVGLFDNALLGKTLYGGVATDASDLMVAAAFRGDTNRDGIVDIEDLGNLANGWQQARGTWTEGDLNGDGFVDIEDLGILANHWQQVGGVPILGGEAFSNIANSEFMAFGAVPEPATFALFGAGIVILLLSRGKSTRVKKKHQKDFDAASTSG